MRTTLKNPYVYFIFVVPTIALYFLFFIYPMLTSVYYGFTNWNGLDTKDYIGFDNFANAFKDEDFRNSILNNLYILLFSCCVQVPLIVVFSLLISGVKRFQGFYKTTVFMPSILSTSVIGILWGYIYDPDVGLINNILKTFGMDPIYFLADTKWALVSILITNAWQWMGFYIVLILAAILAIPRDIDEAAMIDGATGVQRAWYLTVPLIKPIINVVIMLSIAGALRVVDIVLVMTDGGPAGATDVMASYMVNKAIKFGDYGYGTALSIIIFIFALILTALYQILIVRRQEKVEY
ncbi:carbohydrate ABC transporter permease [Cohnella thailandensis]|jgi:ABC-type sugar transport systems, permease components|uniref:Sugar ABC transporter permease n=1 Tax=Cohnella thailandensis TaxID=557557 RepID=A0A841T125_9BACL|nr:sugar ABC transporter permease [Cohnella thailandensis]MBB6636098.1 sugar ABC transporter permease [Cohnella thailandensis]MBP1973933.1 raffinose/stachyose/melibiose transport system permease protein [Cohnella thailandensis]